MPFVAVASADRELASKTQSPRLHPAGGVNTLQTRRRSRRNLRLGPSDGVGR